MAPIMALIPNIFKATSMSLLFVSTAAKLRSLDSKRSWASLPTKTPFRCGCYLNLHQMDKHMSGIQAKHERAPPYHLHTSTVATRWQRAAPTLRPGRLGLMNSTSRRDTAPGRKVGGGGSG